MSTPFPKRLVVEVTEEDIKEGHCGKPHSCAVALALKRRYPELVVTVGLGSVSVYDASPVERLDYNDGLLARWDHSNKAVQFVQSFDRGERVEPCRLTFTRTI